ncbi:MAG: phosphoribosylanthranilate isomerase [Acetomicrobium sp.]
MSLKAKICGLTRKQDVDVAIKAGADAIGFIWAPSPRRVDIDTAKELARDIPPFVSVVAVVRDPSLELMSQIIESKVFDAVQFHGCESVDFVSKCPLKTIKAIAVADEKDVLLVHLYEKEVNFMLFDTKLGKLFGGTGKSFNWQLIKNFRPHKPFILAGGIGPENLEDAIKHVDPDAVDTNSALEVAPGIKDKKKIYEFMKKIKSINNV